MGKPSRAGGSTHTVEKRIKILDKRNKKECNPQAYGRKGITKAVKDWTDQGNINQSPNMDRKRKDKNGIR
jgi:hypothetical protein